MRRGVEREKLIYVEIVGIVKLVFQNCVALLNNTTCIATEIDEKEKPLTIYEGNIENR